MHGPPPILDALEGVAYPSQLAALRRFFTQERFRIYIDDTCEPGWKRTWAAKDQSPTTRHLWATKYGASGYLAHMISQASDLTVGDWRRANATVIPYFDFTTSGLSDWDSPNRSTRLGCLQNLHAHSEAFRELPPDRHFFLLTGERGPCCNDGRYKDVGFLRHRVITQSGDRGAVPIRLSWGGKFNGPYPSPLLLPCYDKVKDVNVPTPNVYVPALLSPASAAVHRERSRLVFAAAHPADSACRFRLIQSLRPLNGDEMRVNVSVPHEEYVLEMRNAKFCPVCGGNAPWTPRLAEAVAHGCVPVLLEDRWEPPFSSLLDYSTFSLRVPMAEMPGLLDRLRAVSAPSLRRMQQALIGARRAFEFHLGGTGQNRGLDGVLPLVVFSMAQALRRPVPPPPARLISTHHDVEEGKVPRSAATIEVDSLSVHMSSATEPTGRILDATNASYGNGAVWMVRERCCGICAAWPLRPHSCHNTDPNPREARCWNWGYCCDFKTQPCPVKHAVNASVPGVVMAHSWPARAGSRSSVIGSCSAETEGLAR